MNPPRYLKFILVTALCCLTAPQAPGAPWISTAQAASASREFRPGGERVDVQLDGDAPYVVTRTGERQLTVRFPDGLPGGAPTPQSFGAEGLVESIEPVGDGFRLTMRSNAFGFVHSSNRDKNRLTLHIFPDRIGARWKEGDGRAVEAASAVPSDAGQAGRSPRRGDPSPVDVGPESGKTGTKAVEAKKAEPVKAVQPAKTAKAAPESPESPKANGLTEPGAAASLAARSAEESAPQAQAKQPGQTDAKRPFYAVPYSMRAPASKAGPRDAQPADAPAERAAPVQLAAAQTGAVSDAPLAAEHLPAKDATPPAAAPWAVQDAPAAPASEQPTPAFTPIESLAPSAGEMRMRIAPPSATGTPPRAAPPELPMTAQTTPPPSARPGQMVEPDVAVPAPQSSQAASAAAKDAKSGKAGKDKARSGKDAKAAAAPVEAKEAVGEAPQSPASASPGAASAPQQPQSGPLATPAAPASIPGGGPADLKEKHPPKAKGEAEHGSAQGKGDKKAPPSPEEELADGQTAMMNGDFVQAAKKFIPLRDNPALKPEMREDVLYSLADSLYQLYRDDLKTNFARVTDAYKEALNVNPKSTRAPTALFYLGLINLKAGNLPEAKGYFTVLRQGWPKDPNIPAINYFYGEYFYNQGQYQKAGEEFQFLVQNYPEHGLTRDAAINLALALNQLGKNDESFKILEYVEQRWPRFYVEYPPILRLMGDGATRLEQWDRARGYYLTYYNLNPRAEDAGAVLARIGDAYVRTGRKSAAKGVYEKVLADFPKGDAALIAKLRLAEEGIHDAPTVEQMFSVFDRPYNMRPAEIYEQIVKERPDSPLAPSAQLKLAMWRLFNRKYPEAIEAAQDFQKKFPNDPLLPRAREVGMRAFRDNVTELLAEENYPKVFELWNRYPFLHENEDGLLPETRIALSYGLWKKGSSDEAIQMASPFLDSYQERKSDMALDLVFSILADKQDWKEIIRFGEKVKGWKIPEDRLRQIDYAMALAYENTADWDKARPLWAKLAQDPKLGASQRAYALYYMARASYDKGDMERTNIWGQEALSLLLQTGDDKTRVKDTIQLLLESTVRTRRFEAALGWATDLEKYLTPGDAEWQTARFRKAEIHKALGDNAKWREIMVELAQKYPATLNGRLASTALSSQKIEDAAKRYVN